jgi:ribosomal protein L11 methyltransferase
MKNPYQDLVIYYFEGTVHPGDEVHSDPRFLGTWQEADTTFVFFSTPVPDLAVRMAGPHSLACLKEVYEMTWEQWHGDAVAPYCVAGFQVFPPWDMPDIQPDKRPIVLDPGVVFGTGRHPTTHDCLALIFQVCDSENLETVVDIGTGTGLLALGAAAMGCSRVLACDFNRLAVQTTRKNIALNGWDDRVLACQAKGETMMDQPCDLLVANIHYDIMQQLIEMPGLLEKRYIILSGLLRSEAHKVLTSLEKKQITILDHLCPDGVWNTFLATP